MKTHAILVFLLLQACGTISLPLEDVGNSQSPEAAMGNSPETLPGRICNNMAVAGLNVSLEYELGSRPQVSVVLSDGDYSETLQSMGEGLEGFRIQESNGIRYAFVQYLSGAFERSGKFRVDLKVAGQTIEQRDIFIKSGECHVEAQSLSFQVKSTQALMLNPSMEYFPLDSGAVIERDPKTSAAKNLTTNKVYLSSEIIREIIEESSGDRPVSSGIRPEKEVSGKVLLGRFNEKGIDRGSLPAGKIKDSGTRRLYAP